MFAESLRKKLIKYSAAVGSVAINTLKVSSQIEYTDISPDFILTGSNNFHSLDLDGDLLDETLLNTFTGSFNGSFSSGPYSGLSCIDYYKGAMARGENNTELLWEEFIDIEALSSNYMINNGAYFYNPSSVLTPLGVQIEKVAQSFSYNTFSYQGKWPGQTDKYLGLKFEIGSDTHYGWIRMDVTPDCDSIIIKDFGYNTVPNQGILAGQTVASVDENESTISIHSYNQTLYVRRNENDAEILQLFSMDGKLIIEMQLQLLSEVISLNEIPKGIYLVQVGNMVKKIII